MSDKPWFTIIAMCVECKFRWIGSVEASTSLFKLECPNCHMQDSFASFIPQEYSDALPETVEIPQLH